MKKWKRQEVQKEIERIKKFVRDFVFDGECIVVPVSGGMDSDIVARLCTESIGKERIRLFIVIQSNMEQKFIENARTLAASLDVPLAEIHLENMNFELMQALENAESEPRLFRTNMFLDPAKAKCSVRSAVLSSYQDKGFLIAGTTNRTEKELGFFLTFGDNLAHLKPIAHLYKSELKEFAKVLGTAQNIIEQAPSAGFWEGQTDAEDLAYWILNDGPIVFPRKFTDAEVERAGEIKELLIEEKVDQVLEAYGSSRTIKDICEDANLPYEIVEGLVHIVEKAKILKNRAVMMELENDI